VGIPSTFAAETQARVTPATVSCTVDIGSTQHSLPLIHLIQAWLNISIHNAASSLNCGQVESLNAKLNVVAEKVDQDAPNPDAACGASTALVNELQSLAEAGRLATPTLPSPLPGGPTNVLMAAEALKEHWCELHRDEGAAVLLADVMNGADVGMIQRGRGPSFALEPAQCLPVASQIVGEELEGHEATKAGILRFVDHAHAAAAELLDDAVVGEGMADQGVSALWRVLGLVGGERSCGHFDSRSFQEVLRVGLPTQQGADLPFQRLITGARPSEKRVALLGRPLEHGLEEAIELFPMIQVHRRFHR
jgi:hypothetical protein